VRRRPFSANLSETPLLVRSPQRRRRQQQLGLCPVSLDVVRAHLGDLRRTSLAETPFSGLSHLIWSAMAILSGEVDGDRGGDD
jgi:hypothetical protein